MPRQKNLHYSGVRSMQTVSMNNYLRSFMFIKLDTSCVKDLSGTIFIFRPYQENELDQKVTYFYHRLLGLCFLLHLQILIVLVVIDWVINTSYRYPIIHASLIDYGRQTVLWKLKVSCLYQSLSSIIVLDTCISEKLPDFLRTRSSSF